jgi:hypothetical protein
MSGPQLDENELARFAALVDAYGASPARWPHERRAWAEGLLARSAEARRQRDAAAQLDGLLDRAAPAAVPADLVGRVLASAPSAREPGRRRSWSAAFWKPAFGLAVAALVGFWLGSALSPFNGEWNEPTDLDYVMAEIE